MIAVKLVCAFVAGVAAHQTYKPSLTFGPHWGSLLRSGIGVVVLLPFVVWFQHGSQEKEPERTIVSYLIASIGVGAGAMVGHMLDR